MARNLELKGMWRICVKEYSDSGGYPKVLFQRAEEIVAGNAEEA